MADHCPTCLRPIATRHTDLTPGVCTKRLGDDQWRRTECFNIGIQVRDEQLAAAKAMNDRARLTLTKLRDQLDLAIGQTAPEVEDG